MQYVSKYKSPLGGITLAAEEAALIGLWFDGQKYFGRQLGKEYEEKELPIFTDTKRWLDIYFSGRKPDFDVPLDFKGSEFQKEVWEIMYAIPYGKTMTYGEMAAALAKKRGIDGMSAQAVGGAVAKNPISILVPCHRVVGSNGSLTGYAGGIAKKVELLKLEGAYQDTFFIPKHSSAP